MSDGELFLEDSPEPVNLSLPLKYQQEILKEIHGEDGLVVLARGLGLMQIVTNLLHSYDCDKNLVFLIGADQRENEVIGERLAALSAHSRVAKGLRTINTELTSVEKRQTMYGEGGIFSATSRIMVVDMLSGLLNPELLTGIVVLRAEKVVATSTEAFILRIFRQKNKEGFVKAFSDNPETFATGFAPLSGTMRNLFLRKAFLWPRFHITVSESLEANKSEAIELDVSMTESMKVIQNSIMECIEICLAELKKGNSQLDIEEWNFDNALDRNFDRIIRRQLDPVWHRVSWKSKQIVTDLATLRQLLYQLLNYDSVTFNRILETIVAINTPSPGSTRQNHSPWLFLDASHTIFETAKGRVIENTHTDDSSDSREPTTTQILEELPKWVQLGEVLDEIESDLHIQPLQPKGAPDIVLIMCSDERTCGQVRAYLQTMYPADYDTNSSSTYARSGKRLMQSKLNEYYGWKKSFVTIRAALDVERHNGATNKGA